jgi:transposase
MKFSDDENDDNLGLKLQRWILCTIAAGAFFWGVWFLIVRLPEIMIPIK